MTAILVTDGLLRKSLSLTRSLGRAGLIVHTAERTRCTPAAFSKHCKKALQSPDPRKQRAAYGEWLHRVLASGAYEFFIPSDDAAMEIALADRERVEACTTILLPPPNSYRQAADKRLTMELAKRAQVPHPQTYCLETESAEEIERLAPRLNYPVVVKPRQSSGSRGIRVAADPAELAAVYREVAQQHPLPLIQECIPTGERYDVALLYDRDGRLKASFVQREVRHYPLPIGPSTMQESVHRPDLVELALRLMQHLPWQGVVEIEFMIDPRDGTPKLMEINPRWWNSLEMAVQAGVDFPYLYYLAGIGQEFAAVHEYKTGLFCRNLLPGDLLHLLAKPRGQAMQPPFWPLPQAKVQDDILSRDDPWAAFGFAAGVLRLLFDREVWKMMFRR